MLFQVPPKALHQLSLQPATRVLPGGTTHMSVAPCWLLPVVAHLSRFLLCIQIY